MYALLTILHAIAGSKIMDTYSSMYYNTTYMQKQRGMPGTLCQYSSIYDLLY